MTEKVLKVSADDSFGVIRDILRNVDFHHLLVMQGRKLVGILSDRDFLKAVGPHLSAEPEPPGGRSFLDQRVHMFMTRDPITVERETSIKTAARLMLEHGISCLPVLSADGRVEGIVTMKDLLKSLAEKEGA